MSAFPRTCAVTYAITEDGVRGRRVDWSYDGCPLRTIWLPADCTDTPSVEAMLSVEAGEQIESALKVSE